ncbi:MAG TPA: MarR family winged helix-turn-helix transcriptional regulator [Candidimonas sp.]|nr:MarR family winged helix-turn-helix transcriptional regulator [Candidimonas sp.]
MSDIPQLQVLQQLGRTYRTLMSAFEANIGHSMPRWRILIHLYQGGEASQKQLAHTLRIDPAALTRQIKAIERMGWVERHSDPADNRLTNVALTPGGMVLVEEALPKRAAFIESALGDLSAQDLEALETILGKLEQRLRVVGPAQA